MGSTSFTPLDVEKIIKCTRSGDFHKRSDLPSVRKVWGVVAKKKRNYIPHDILSPLGYDYGGGNESVALLKLTNNRFMAVWVSHCNSSGSCISWAYARLAQDLDSLIRFGITDKQRSALGITLEGST
eukprot:TRINITY_DN7025_c0_g1_i2.p1 TRINITY_DN7025_c0_g1~~TRINITY_DN7025_c0_g1_i2.p1  ORF type:complete len:127 (+),score=12.53 TRINITY_DN7025_c0_g1_i2:3-383(+)